MIKFKYVIIFFNYYILLFYSNVLFEYFVLLHDIAPIIIICVILQIFYKCLYIYILLNKVLLKCIS